MPSFRPLALGSLALSLTGLLGGLAWAVLAFDSNAEQSGVGILFGLLVAGPCALLTLLCGLALGLHRTNPGAARTVLTVAGAGALAVGVSLLSFFSPVPR